MKRILLLTLAVIPLLAGCATIISEESRRLVDQSVSFATLRENPDGQLGKIVMLGGIIAAVRNSKEGGELEVVQLPLDGDGVPGRTVESGGRFLVTSPDFLDRFVYQPGWLLTLVGEVRGKMRRSLDGVDYTYPLLTLRESHVWPAQPNDWRSGYRVPGSIYNPYEIGTNQGLGWYHPDLSPPERPR